MISQKDRLKIIALNEDINYSADLCDLLEVMECIDEYESCNPNPIMAERLRYFLEDYKMNTSNGLHIKKINEFLGDRL